MQDEGELIRAAAGGDPRAFDELVLLKREKVVRTAYQVTGDLEEARDVARSSSRLWKVFVSTRVAGSTPGSTDHGERCH
jgi:hypothetical protein